MRTRLTELLGIEYPIVQGGMQWIGTADLAVAVSNAGALGVITARTHDSGEHLLAEIQRAKSLTGRPLAVNISVSRNVEQDYSEWVEAVIESGVRIVETAGNNPRAFLPKLKDHGVTVIHKCTTVRHALSAERLGADIISMDGFEAAGHPGEYDTPVLIAVPAVLRAVEVPVIASGGISDGRGVAAALMLGADGVNLGTRFMLTEESPMNENLKEDLLAATIYDSQLIQRSFGNTGRYLRNAISEEIVDTERQYPADFSKIRHLVAGSRGRDALFGGNRDGGLICVGQTVGLIGDVPNCADLVKRMMRECHEAVQDASVKFRRDR